MNTRTILLPFALALTFAGACDQPSMAGFEATTADGDPEFRCLECVFNSPSVNDFGAGDMRVDGLPNEDGVSFAGIRSTEGMVYDLEIIDDEFAAQTSGGLLMGAQLVGWDLLLDTGGDIIPVHIYAAETQASWADGAASFTKYALNYPSQDPGIRHNICPSYLLDPEIAVVTLIRNERYDRAAIEVIPNQTDWVTLACEDEATFKMKRMNYGPNDDFGGAQPASVAQRQATLKMITADYCGVGHSFTQQGTPLHWRNTANNVDSCVGGDCTSIEAVWTENGALCVRNPRLYKNSIEDIRAICPEIPACTATHLTQNHEWMTWAAE